MSCSLILTDTADKLSWIMTAIMSVAVNPTRFRLADEEENQALREFHIIGLLLFLAADSAVLRHDRRWLR